jgi:hypothetical protein
MPPTIARHSEKEMTTLMDAFVSFWYLSLFFGFVCDTQRVSQGTKICQVIICVGQGPSDHIPSVGPSLSCHLGGGPYFGNTQVLLGCKSLHKMAPVARTISWGQWDERACTWTSWSANIVETKTAVPLQSVSHIYRSLFQIMAQKKHPSALHDSTCNNLLTELQDCDL